MFLLRLLLFYFLSFYSSFLPLSSLSMFLSSSVLLFLFFLILFFVFVIFSFFLSSYSSFLSLTFYLSYCLLLLPFFTPPIHCSRVFFFKKKYINKITEYHKVLIYVSMIRILSLILMYRSLTHTYRSPFYLLFCFIQYIFCLILALIHLQNHQFVPGLIDLFLSVCHINHEKIFTRICAQKCVFVPF